MKINLKIATILILLVSQQTSAQWVVNGTVNYSDGVNVTSGTVYLISKDIYGNNQIEAQAQIGSNGNYEAVVNNNVDCLPIAIPDDEFDYLPTGFPNCLIWDHAQVISPTWVGPVIFECERVLNERPIFVGNKIKVNGTVLSNNRGVNLAVLYFYQNGNYAGSSITDETGKFEILLQDGDYSVLVSAFNEKSIKKEIEISNSQTQFEFYFSGIEKFKDEGYLKLFNNYPNPFNPTTTIKFGIDFASMVRVSILDSRGAEISLIKNEYLNAGVHQLIFNADFLPSGIYYIKVYAGRYSQTQKIVLLK